MYTVVIKKNIVTFNLNSLEKKILYMSKVKLFSVVISSLLLVGIVFQLYNLYFNPNKNSVEFTIENAPIISENNIVIGSDTTTHILFMYTSYSCGYCTNFFNDVYPQLKDNYIDRNKLKLILKFTNEKEQPELMKALKLSICTYKFGSFWDLHELLNYNSGIIYDSKFDLLVDDIIIDNEVIAACMYDDEIYQEIINCNKEYIDFELKGTPTFIYNNTVYTGYRDFEFFEQLFN